MNRFVALSLLPLAFAASAQQATTQKPPPSPEEMKKIMDTSMSAVAPAMAKMTDAMMEQMLQRGEDPETARRIAKFKKNLYDALMKEGFSKDQALSIVVNTGLPSASTLGR